MRVKTQQFDNVISLKDAFSVLEDHYLIPASLALHKIFSIESKKNEVFDSFLPLKCSFSVHYNEMIWKILSFFLDSNGANSQITQSK